MTAAARALEKSGFKGNINDVVDNSAQRQGIEREVKLRLALHAQGGGIHQETHSGHGLRNAMPLERLNSGAEAPGKAFGAGKRTVADIDPASPLLHERGTHGPRCT